MRTDTLRIRSGALLLAFGVLALCRPAAAEIAPVTGWDRQLFPSYLIATATVQLPEDDTVEADDTHLLGDRQGVLGVVVTSPADEAPVTVTITGPGVLEETTFTGTLPEEGVAYTILPKVKYDYAALARNKQSVPVPITFRVEAGDAESEEETVTFTLRSINDCPFYIHHDDEITDVSFVFAAYVNEQHPFCDKLLREALDTGAVDSFIGYQSGDKADVYRQAYALWHALSLRDVRYSNITTSAAASPTVSSQHVRLIDESINNKQANCVDGSVLLASLLRKIDIEPVLVYVPGHCYMGFYLDNESKQLELLETTLIGSESEDAPAVEGLNDVVDADWQKQNSWKTFAAAIAAGRADYEENKDRFGGENPDYQVVSIAAARALGILPIAFDGDSEFEAKAADEAEE